LLTVSVTAWDRLRPHSGRRVLALIEAGKLDPSPLVTHHMKLDEVSEAYAIYDRREALKIVLTP